MNIGPYEIKIVENGFFGLDGGAMFGIVPKPLWEKKIPSDSKNRIPLGLRSMLLLGPNRKIIVETGIGTSFPPKEQEIYAIDHKTVNTTSSLKTVGLTSKDITDVFITHLHFDHVGGATYLDKNKEPALTYPNAKYYVQKEQWEWAQKPTEKDQGSFIHSLFDPLKESGKLELIDGPGSWLPNIEIVVANGHTVGLQMLYLSEGSDSILFCSDLIPTSAHLGLPWIMGYDIEPLVTLEEKKLWLKRMHEENGYLFFGHDPRIAYGKVERDERGRYHLIDPYETPLISRN